MPSFIIKGMFEQENTPFDTETLSRLLPVEHIAHAVSEEFGEDVDAFDNVQKIIHIQTAANHRPSEIKEALNRFNTAVFVMHRIKAPITVYAETEEEYAILFGRYFADGCAA